MVLEQAESQGAGKIRQISLGEFEKILESGAIQTTNPHFDSFQKSQISKYYYDKSLPCYIYEDELGVGALIICNKPKMAKAGKECFIYQFTSFRRGCGAQLLSYVLDSCGFDVIRLEAYTKNSTDLESLLRYYRNPRFKLKETVERDKDNNVHHLFLRENRRVEDDNFKDDD